jgi:Hemerythrin HHE cation binding domain
MTVTVMIGNLPPNRIFLISGGLAADEIQVRFSRLLDAQARICDELEGLADCLPDSVDAQECLRTARRLVPLVTAAHDFEEAVLFPLLEVRIPHMVHLASTLERLRFEHWGDQEFALDVRHALREFVRRRDSANVDSLAWMLRGFFDGLRRHIAFDREYLLPIIVSVSENMRDTDV